MINFCGNCGTKLTPGDKTCPTCGRAIPSSEPAPSKPTADHSAGASADSVSNANSSSSADSSTKKSSPSAPTPEAKKRADLFFWLVIGLYALPIVADILSSLSLTSGSDVLISLGTVLSWVSSLSSLAALALIIYARVKFGFSQKIRILFWVIIGLIIFRIVYLIFAMLACVSLLTLFT